ncbi:MAG: succinate dehydrogenase / fumarate reductase cytochrome b subunit [Gammaproteobacteria bacterium]|jgi:succinate dehydrogenase / fumarate reductase cytochrome b subunit
MASSSRPISPHLSVYKPQLTSVLSITHRATGVFLSAGLVPLAYWLVGLAMGPTAYANAQEVLGSIWGRVALFLWTFAFFYHMCNGIRHLFWDAGMGFDLKMVYLSGKITVAAAVGLTLLTWIVAYSV